MEEKKDKIRRIDIKVKRMPNSLRKFIGEIMTDEEKFINFAESPVEALVKAHVPIDASKFTIEDAEHLVLVMGKLHAYVKLNKFPKDAKFDDIFNVGISRLGYAAYVSYESHTRTWVNITPHTVTYTETNRGIGPNFGRDGLRLEKFENVLVSPLISQSEFKETMSLIEKTVDSEIGML
jgi:hypothetical protein